MWIFRWLILLFFLLLFLFIATIKLDEQGLYSDEVLFAPGAYAYQGSKEYLINRFSFQNIPIFTTSYQGAVKSFIYGLYLNIFHADFTVQSWRLSGIILFSLGLLTFTIFTAKSLKIYQFVIFLILLLTDITVLLNVRIDWGPVVISLVARLIFLGIAIKALTQNKISSLELFLTGLLIGIAIFEKLSSALMLVPLFLLIYFLSTDKIIRIKNIIFTFVGLSIGLLPVIIVNLIYLIKERTIFSFLDLPIKYQHSYPNFFKYISDYLSLGNGRESLSFILGQQIPELFIIVEQILLLFFIIFISLLIYKYFRKSNKIPIAFYFFLNWILIGFLLYLPPIDNGARFYILGTPFQYIAIIYLFKLIYSVFKKSNLRKLITTISIFGLIFWLSFRLISISNLVKFLYQGKYSDFFHTSFTKIGIFASTKTSDSLFIASDWGVANQIFLLTDGKNHFIYELFWNYAGIDQLKKIVSDSKKKYLYLVSKIPPAERNIINKIKIEYDIHHAPFLIKVPVETDIRNLKTVKVEKFMIILMNLN